MHRRVAGHHVELQADGFGHVEHFGEHGGTGADATWLVSGNPWDVIGARAAGLHAAWVQRDPNRPYDPWGDPPDLVACDLAELAAHPAFTGAND